MDNLFEELDFRETPLGDLILQRRKYLRLGGEVVYEVKLGEAFLMSSMFHAVEEAGRKFHAVLLDIDHSPRNLLAAQNAVFYTPEGCAGGGVHRGSGKGFRDGEGGGGGVSQPAGDPFPKHGLRGEALTLGWQRFPKSLGRSRESNLLAIIGIFRVVSPQITNPNSLKT